MTGNLQGGVTDKMNLDKRIHFIGIGGTGMSGLAKVFMSMGHKISGSDIAENSETVELSQMGAMISIGHDEQNLPDDVGKIVVSTAINKKNPELIAARKRNIPVCHRSDILAELFLDSQRSVAVSGCHGKTTVSSIIATILSSAKKDPTCVIGGQVAAIGSNACAGKSDILVAEADESDASFLKYFATYGVITNIDNDHMDHYSSMNDIIKAFEIFASHISHDGALYVCADDPVVRNLKYNRGQKVITYGIDTPADIMADNIHHAPYSSSFDYLVAGVKKARFHISIPGKHNVLNALPAIAFCLELGLSINEITEGLNLFCGAGRRFEIKGICDGITVIDDYGHHPNEIKATLDAAQTLNARRVVVVFQPHRYSRTLFLSREFGRCFDMCDKLFITDIFAASEKPIPGVSSKVILDHMPVAHRKKVKMVKNIEDVKYHILNYIEPGDVVFTMGAGTVTTVGPQLLDTMRANSSDFAEVPVKAAV